MSPSPDSATLTTGATEVASIENVSLRWRERFDRRLEARIGASPDSCPKLLAAMRYGLLAPGKRVRPLLAVMTSLSLDRDPARVLDFGCALEMVHCASLLLDDLPCMDDARVRRGRAACHREYGEATTTLAAIALLNRAYGVLAEAGDLEDARRVDLVGRLSAAIGTAGLVSGQSRDLARDEVEADGETLRRIHAQKTGVLFELAVTGAGIIGGISGDRLSGLTRAAHHVGVAFQLADDLLDCARHAGQTGKTVGRDAEKSGSVHDVGPEPLKRRLDAERAAAGRALDDAGAASGELREFIDALFLRFE